MLSAAVIGAVLTFTLQTIPLDDGGTLSGSFVWDSVSDQVTTWDLNTSTGHSFDGLEYTPSNSTGHGDHIRLELHIGSRVLTLAFGHSLLERGLYHLGGSYIDPYSEDTFERQANYDAGGLYWFPYRAPVAAQAYPFASVTIEGDVSAVPEPTTLLWLSLTLVAALGVRRLRSAGFIALSRAEDRARTSLFGTS
jgi:hypothetical protein